MPGAKIELRPADIYDRDRVLEWSNDTETRAASFDTAPIAPASHNRWFAACLRGERALFIAENAGETVGMARLEPAGPAGALVSLTIAPECRGRRLAQPVLEALIEAARVRGLANLTALVRVENSRSRSLFAKAGFSETGTARVAGAEAVRYELCLVDAAETETGRG